MLCVFRAFSFFALRKLTRTKKSLSCYNPPSLIQLSLCVSCTGQLSKNQRVSRMSEHPLHESYGKSILSCINAVSVPVSVKVMLSGSIAGITARLLTAPLERVKILMQIQPLAEGTRFTGLTSSLLEISRSEGWRFCSAASSLRGQGIFSRKPHQLSHSSAIDGNSFSRV